MSTRLWCPQCDSFRTPEEVDFENIPVQCGMCGTAIVVDDGKPVAKALPKRRRIPVPDNFSVESDDYYLRISYRPREFFGIDITLIAMLVSFCVISSIFLALPLDLNIPVIQGVLIFLLAGIAVLFGKLSGRLIRTVITVGGGHLEIRHNLLPWLGGKSLYTDHIYQLYATSDRHIHGTSKATYQMYQLRAIIHGDKHIRLLGGLGTLHEAAYLEQTIEEHLRIADRPVPGSVSL